MYTLYEQETRDETERRRARSGRSRRRRQAKDSKSQVPSLYCIVTDRAILDYFLIQYLYTRHSIYSIQSCGIIQIYTTVQQLYENTARYDSCKAVHMCVTFYAIFRWHHTHYKYENNANYGC